LWDGHAAQRAERSLHARFQQRDFGVMGGIGR
jgi:hypothetical protein